MKPLPNDWQMKKLKDVCAVVTGSTPSTLDRSNYGDEFLFVSPADISENVKIVKNTINKLSVKGFSLTRRVPKANVLFVCIGSTIGKIALTGEELATNQQINACVTHSICESSFLYYALYFNAKEIKLLAGKQAVPIINKTTFEGVSILLPPLAEQKAIAQILSTWDDAIEKTQLLITAKEKQKRALMQKLLTGKHRFRGFIKTWRVLKLGELGAFLKGKGILQKDVTEEGLPCVRYAEIYTEHDVVIKEFKSHIPITMGKESQRLQYGDIIFTCSGETHEDIGKCVAFVDDFEAYVGSDTVVLSYHKQNPIFMGYYLNSESIVSQKRTLGHGSSIVHIHAPNLAKIDIQLPCIGEQIAIASVLEAASNEIVKLKKILEHYKQQKHGLMQKLLAGTWRVNKNCRDEAEVI